MVSPSNFDLILYDGVCGLCNRWVRFVLRRDRRAAFRFAALQSGIAERIAPGQKLDTIVVVTASEQVLTKSCAVLYVLSRLGGVWRLGALLRIFPTVLLDLAYDVVAKIRYRVFGRYERCPLPEERYRYRFVDG